MTKTLGPYAAARLLGNISPQLLLQRARRGLVPVAQHRPRLRFRVADLLKPEIREACGHRDPRGSYPRVAKELEIL